MLTPFDILLLVGLMVEVIGVYVLVTTSDIGFRFILEHLGRTVPNDWTNRIRQVRNRNSLRTGIGVTILAIGVFMQYFGIAYEKIFGWLKGKQNHYNVKFLKGYGFSVNVKDNNSQDCSI